MTVVVCGAAHSDVCFMCDKPVEQKCPVHGKCRCWGKNEVGALELIVGYRFQSQLINGIYQPPFKGGLEGTVITSAIPIAGPVFKRKDRGKVVVRCMGCGESQTSQVDHSWLKQWAYKHRCKSRVDMPR